MTVLDSLISVTVAVLALGGFGWLLGVPRRHRGVWGYLDQVLVSTYMSLIVASVIVFALGEFGLTDFRRGSGGSWGEYPVLGSPSDRAMAAFSLSAVFVVMVAIRPIASRLVASWKKRRRTREEEVSEPLLIPIYDISAPMTGGRDRVPEVGPVPDSEEGYEVVSTESDAVKVQRRSDEGDGA